MPAAEAQAQIDSAEFVGAMISTELCGILLMISTGICVTSEMVTSKLIEASGWPYWYLLAGSSLLATIFNGLALWWRRTEVPARSDLKWVLARSVFEDLHWCLGAWVGLRGRTHATRTRHTQATRT